MIEVTEKYYIKVDDCYTVYEKAIVQTGKKQGEENYINPSYYGTLTQALNNVIHRVQKDKLKSDEVISLKEVVKLLVDIQKEFAELVKGIENYD